MKLFTSKSLNKFDFINPLSTERFISKISSSIEPIHFFSLPSSEIHIGSGIPQNLDLDRFQSFTFSNHFSNLPSPVDFGFQFISLFKEDIFSLTVDAFINHESTG